MIQADLNSDAEALPQIEPPAEIKGPPSFPGGCVFHRISQAGRFTRGGTVTFSDAVRELVDLQIAEDARLRGLLLDAFEAEILEARR